MTVTIDGQEYTAYWRVWTNPRNGQRYGSTHYRKRTPVEHGTAKGYEQERQRGLVPCRPCLDAANTHRAAQRARKAAAGAG